MRDNLSLRPAGRVALFGLLLAAALILSYLEGVLILPVTVPGVKPGLSNITLLTAVAVFDPLTALVFGMVKCLLSLLFGGRLSSLFFSAAGTLFAVIGMALTEKCGKFSFFGVSICGSVLHIWGQLCAAAILTETPSVFALTPLLTGFAVISGIVTAIPVTVCMPVFKKILHRTF